MRTGFLLRAAAVLVLAVLGQPGRASAWDIVQDGDFELADPASTSLATTYFDTTAPDIGDHAWFVTRGAVGVFTDYAYFNYAGHKSIYLPGDPDNADGGLTQILSTTPGQLYRISFWANADDPGNRFSLTFGGVAVQGIPGSIDSKLFGGGGSGNGFTHYSGTAVATSNSTALTFYDSAPQGNVMIDNVSVNAVPEPSSISLGGTAALIGLSVWVGRARSRRVSWGRDPSPRA